MSVFKALQDVTYYPDGPGKSKTVSRDGLITLDDEMDYLVGTQINPAHVEKVDPEVIKKAVKAADDAKKKTIEGK